MSTLHFNTPHLITPHLVLGFFKTVTRKQVTGIIQLFRKGLIKKDSMLLQKKSLNFLKTSTKHPSFTCIENVPILCELWLPETSIRLLFVMNLPFQTACLRTSDVFISCDALKRVQLRDTSQHMPTRSTDLLYN